MRGVLWDRGRPAPKMDRGRPARNEREARTTCCGIENAGGTPAILKRIGEGKES
jgi:hypothetical protein